MDLYLPRPDMVLAVPVTRPQASYSCYDCVMAG